MTIRQRPHNSLPGGPVMIPDIVMFGVVHAHEEDCPEHTGPILVAHYQTDDIAYRVALRNPDIVAGHLASLWALAISTYGQVGFHAALERAVHEANLEAGEKRIRL